MGTTSNLGLPFPEAADPFGLGNEQIEALAEAVDDYFSQWAKLVRSSTQNFVTATPSLIQWTAASSDLTADFEHMTETNTDDSFRYLGPDRFVSWRCGIKLPNSLSSGLSLLTFRRRVTATLGSDDYIVSRIDLADISSSSPHNFSGLVWMETGSEWQFIYEQTTGSTRAVSAYAAFKGI